MAKKEKEVKTMKKIEAIIKPFKLDEEEAMEIVNEFLQL